MKPIEALLFLAYGTITALVGIDYLLRTSGTPIYNTVMFYLFSWGVFLSLLLGMEVFHVPKWTEWTEGLGRGNFPVWILGLTGMFVCASFIPKLVAGAAGLPSAILVPTPLTTLAQANTFDFFTTAQDVLFNMSLVGMAEQILQLVPSIIIFALLSQSKRLKGTVWPMVSAIVLPVGVWAGYHTYQAYVGAETFGLTLAAFGAGLVMMGVLYKTKSLIAVALLHGAFNAVVIIMAVLLRMLGINF